MIPQINPREIGSAFHWASISQGRRRDCGKGPFLDGNYLAYYARGWSMSREIRSRGKGPDVGGQGERRSPVKFATLVFFEAPGKHKQQIGFTG